MEALQRLTNAIKPGLRGVEVHPRDVVAVADLIPGEARSGVVNTLRKGCAHLAADPNRDARPNPNVLIFTDDLKTLIFEASKHAKGAGGGDAQ